jgi:DNA-directed RNA polymerase specialized sigma24 family protein
MDRWFIILTMQLLLILLLLPLTSPAADPPLSPFCLKLLVRLAEYRNVIKRGQFQNNPQALPPEVVSKLIDNTLSKEEQDSLKLAQGEAYKPRHKTAPDPVHEYVAGLLNKEKTTRARPLFKEESDTLFDPIEFSRLMVRAREGNAEAKETIGTLLPAILQKIAKRRLGFLDPETREELIQRVLFRVIKGNYAFNIGKVRWQSGEQPVASYFAVALRRALQRYTSLKIREVNQVPNELAGSDIMDTDTLLSRIAQEQGDRRMESTHSPTEAINLLKRLEANVLPLMSSRERETLRMRFGNPNVSLDAIAKAIGANSYQAADLVYQRAQRQLKEIHEQQENGRLIVLSKHVGVLTEKDLDAFAEIAFADRLAAHVARSLEMTKTELNNAYLRSVSQMEASVRKNEPEKLDDFWDDILSTNGPHAEVLDALVEQSLNLGKPPPSGELPLEISEMGITEERVYGTNSYRAGGKSDQSHFFESRATGEWLVAREIHRRKQVLSDPEMKKRYSYYNPYRRPLRSLQTETNEDRFRQVLLLYREEVQENALDTYLRHYLVTGQVIEDLQLLSEKVQMNRARLLSQGVEFRAGGNSYGTGLFEGESDFYSKLEKRLKRLESSLGKKLNLAIGTQTKGEIEKVQAQVQQLTKLALRARVNVIELPSTFREHHPIIGQAFHELPPLEQNVIALRWGSRKSLSETAKEMGISTDLVVEQEALAIGHLRRNLRESGRELGFALEVDSIGTSLPTQIAEMLYQNWAKEPASFHFEGVSRFADDLVLENWPFLSATLRSRLFQGQNHLAWSLRKRIEAHSNFLGKDAPTYLAHRRVVEKAQAAAQSRTAMTNPFWGEIDALSGKETESSPPRPKPAKVPKDYTKIRRVRKDTEKKEFEKAMDEGLAALAPQTLAVLKQFELNHLERAIVKAKWIEGLSEEDLSTILRTQDGDPKKLHQAESSLIYRIVQSATKHNNELSVARELLVLPTLHQSMPQEVIETMRQGEDLEEAVATYKTKRAIPAAKDTKTAARPFLHPAHRTWALDSLLQQSDPDSQLRRQLLRPYAKGAAATMGTKTAFQRELMERAQELGVTQSDSNEQPPVRISSKVEGPLKAGIFPTYSLYSGEDTSPRPKKGFHRTQLHLAQKAFYSELAAYIKKRTFSGSDFEKNVRRTIVQLLDAAPDEFIEPYLLIHSAGKSIDETAAILNLKSEEVVSRALRAVSYLEHQQESPDEILRFWKTQMEVPFSLHRKLVARLVDEFEKTGKFPTAENSAAIASEFRMSVSVLFGTDGAKYALGPSVARAFQNTAHFHWALSNEVRNRQKEGLAGNLNSYNPYFRPRPKVTNEYNALLVSSYLVFRDEARLRVAQYVKENLLNPQTQQISSVAVRDRVPEALGVSKAVLFGNGRDDETVLFPEGAAELKAVVDSLP